MEEFHYVGSELDLFAAATNWKSYWSKRLARYISGDVLEVGAGIGSNTRLLSAGTGGEWVCLEPDPKLVDQLIDNLKTVPGAERFRPVCGTLETAMSGESFDTLLYIDVLEHIEDDAGELRAAAAKLRPGGRVIVLSPAHQRLYTPFDAAIGHFRRYSRASLRRVSPPGLEMEALFYLDSCGIFASAANRLLLRQSMPTKVQIGTWDTWIIPVSRVLDPLLGYSVGKTVVGVWRKPKLSANG